MLMRYAGFLALCLLSACVSSRPRGCATRADGTELLRLQPSADSLARRLRSTTDSGAIATVRASLELLVARTKELESCGQVASAPELRTAARIALAASTLGEPTVTQAYLWARRAVVADSADYRSWRLMAQAWDRLQLLQARPQWFGTVINCAGTPVLRCTLAPTDTTRVSDPQLVELGLRTIVQQRLRVDSLNRARGVP